MFEQHPDNFCGGNYQDWVEVMLTTKCNAGCEWCVEKRAIHPQGMVSYKELAKTILEEKKKNVILLGGEPTLYKNLKELIFELRQNDINVYLTTNAYLISKKFVKENLLDLTGVSFSIHHYDLEKNKEITKILLKEDLLLEGIEELNNRGIPVRLNCNLQYKYIDTKEEVLSYISWAKKIKASSVRFAELKFDEGNFIGAETLFVGEYGLSRDPMKLGCSKSCEINGMSVNFRQMCGLQTHRRIPHFPEVIKNTKSVLYYNGKVYDGWQQEENEESIEEFLVKRSKYLTEEEMIELIEELGI